MHESTGPRRRATFFMGAAFLLLLVTGIGMAWMLAKRSAARPSRVLLVSPPGDAKSGLDATQCRAIGALVQDYLEHFGGLAVTSVTALPKELRPLHAKPRSLVLVLEPRRQNDQLILSHRFVWSDQLQEGKAVPWVIRDGSPRVPEEAFRVFSREFPHVLPERSTRLTPRNSGAFWNLLQAMALRLRNERLDEATDLAQEVVRQEPDCATAWILLGNLGYRRLLNNPAAFRQDQADTEALLRKGLALAPEHPRGTLLLSLIKSDGGNQREALDLLTEARRIQPHNPSLLTGVAYAARGAGLLSLARRAMDLRDHLAFAQYQPQALDITCLYTWEIPRFEASLQEAPGHLRSTSGILPFYRGYLALVQGDRARAHEEFTLAMHAEHGYPNIIRLSEVYDLILDGNRDQAWKKLREYDQERIGMREPDGEFTIRLAEAYALMGDRASSMEMANRAFARGFGCTAWYERSPMLGPLRGLPKWKALLQHLKERQSLMEDRFPATLVENPS